MDDLSYRGRGKDVPLDRGPGGPLGPSARDRNEHCLDNVMLRTPQRVNGTGVNKPAVHPKGHPAKLPDGLFPLGKRPSKPGGMLQLNSLCE